jgi:dTDP-4-dehydrorhamnose reductase
MLSALAEGRRFGASRTSFVSPTYLPDLCHATLDLLVDGERGLWHLANQGRMSWYEFAVRVAQEAGCNPALIDPEDGAPADNSLSSRHGHQLRPVEEAIADYARVMRDALRSATLVAAE